MQGPVLTAEHWYESRARALILPSLRPPAQPRAQGIFHAGAARGACLSPCHHALPLSLTACNLLAMRNVPCSSIQPPESCCIQFCSITSVPLQEILADPHLRDVRKKRYIKMQVCAGRWAVDWDL